MDGEFIEVRFMPTWRDRLRINLSLSLRSPVAWLFLPWFPLAGLALLTLQVTLIMYGAPLDWSAVVAALLSLAFVPVMFGWGVYIGVREDRRVQGYCYRFGPEGLQVTSSVAELKQPWSAIERVRNDSQLLYVYIRRNCAHFIPLRSLSSTDELAKIQAMAHAAGVARTE